MDGNICFSETQNHIFLFKLRNIVRLCLYKAQENQSTELN